MISRAAGPFAVIRPVSRKRPQRGTRAEQIFGARFPGEYVMSGIARLLDSLAREMRENHDLSHDLVSAATELSEHVLAYLPKIEKQR
jgi:hypothetical protein